MKVKQSPSPPSTPSQGLSVIMFMTFIEMFGSPFLRNCNILLSLFFG